LIVDFGGGTCDFAFLHSLEECLSWGDMELGGRLFDDLFFQWLLEQNAGVTKEIARAGDTYYVHSYLCREVKEFFSLTMARDRAESVNKSVGRYGSIRGMSWDTFSQKARAYNPSPAFISYLQGIGLESDKLTKRSNPIDLIEWFRESLTQGLADKDINTGDIGRVILAGGSSQWPFVYDVISEALGLDPSKLMRSDRPYAVISEGLAILSPLKRQFEKTRKKLRDELGEFCQTKVRPLVGKITEAYVADVAADITLELFDKKIKPVLQEYRASGGSLALLKKNMSLKANSFEPELKKIIEDRMKTLRMGLPEQVRDLLTRWIASYGLSVGDAQIEQGRKISIGSDARKLGSAGYLRRDHGHRRVVCRRDRHQHRSNPVRRSRYGCSSIRSYRLDRRGRTCVGDCLFDCPARQRESFGVGRELGRPGMDNQESPDEIENTQVARGLPITARKEAARRDSNLARRIRSSDSKNNRAANRRHVRNNPALGGTNQDVSLP